MANSAARYRVIPLSEDLRECFKRHREANDLTNQQVIASAVQAHLARLVEGLKELGFGIDTGSTRPARLPFDDEAGTLAELSDASESLSSIPTSTLLRLCLLAETSQETTKSSRQGRSRKTASKASSISQRKAGRKKTARKDKRRVT